MISRSKFAIQKVYFCFETIKTKGYYEMLLFHCIILLLRGLQLGAGANNHRFAFLITDEDIDLVKGYTNQRSDTEGPSRAAGISLTVVGETRERL